MSDLDFFGDAPHCLIKKTAPGTNEPWVLFIEKIKSAFAAFKRSEEVLTIKHPSLYGLGCCFYYVNYSRIFEVIKSMP